MYTITLHTRLLIYYATLYNTSANATCNKAEPNKPQTEKEDSSKQEQQKNLTRLAIHVFQWKRDGCLICRLAVQL